MQEHVIQPTGLMQYLIPVAVFIVIFALRARRMSQVRPLSLRSLRIVPALYLLIVIAAFVRTSPNGVGWAAALVGLAAGCVIGWYRGKSVAIHLDPATGKLMQRASPLAILILLALVLAKTAAPSIGSAERLDVAALTDALLMIALGTFAVMRLEMFLRARRLLAD
ncbi:MAG: DUF1453 family protein [Pseudomonadota bacterium]|nr:DUF1453 family protein [Pseudomonadota bacterium]